MGVLNALTVPSRVARRVAYRRRRRADWDVLVYRGWIALQHQRDAVYRERCADLQAAGERGEAIWASLVDNGTLPCR